jgi:hypothetical protein
MPFRVHTLALLPALLLAPGAVAAQPTARAAVDTGAVVRVTAHARGMTRVRARAESASPDSLRVRLDGPAERHVTLAWSDVTALDRSLGADRAAGVRRGARTGALIFAVPLGGGAAVAYLYDWRRDRSDRCGEYCYFGPVVLGLGAVVGTGVGALLGAAIGSANPVDRWEPVAVPARVGFVPLPNGLGLRLAF